MNESGGEAFIDVPTGVASDRGAVSSKSPTATGSKTDEKMMKKKKKKKKKKSKAKRSPRLWAQFHSSSFDALQLAADALEWELLDGSRRSVADIIWLSCGETSHQMRKLVSILDKTKLKSSTRLPLVSRIPGMSEVSSKTMTCLLLERARALFPELYAFVPQTFSLPEEKTAFQRYVLDQKEKRGAVSETKTKTRTTTRKKRTKSKTTKVEKDTYMWVAKSIVSAGGTGRGGGEGGEERKSRVRAE